MNSSRRAQWLIRLLCILGIGVASYLTWSHLADAVPYCGGAHGCSDVQNSPYSKVAGVPVSVIGLTGYLLLLTLSLLRGRLNAEIDFFLPVLSFGAALIGVLYSAYLTYLEAFVILAWCYWCVTSAIIITVVWVLSTIDLRRAWAKA
jgi:uncharacterized membrane protein